jgi:hypothetical protein
MLVRAIRPGTNPPFESIPSDRLARPRAENVIASTAFKCSDVKARPAGGDPCQRCCCFALWTMVVACET